MPGLRYFLVKGGDIVGYSINRTTKAVEEVVISSGELTGYNWDGKKTEVTFKVTTGKQGSFGGDEQVTAMTRENLKVKGLLTGNNIFKGPILSEKEILPDQLPKQRAPSPYISILNQRAGVPTVEGNEVIRILGKNFSLKAPLEVLLDGVKVTLRPEPRPDASGTFRLRIPQVLEMGNHTVLVRQTVDGKVLQDATTFVKTITDQR
jgi:hypothetical protein